MVTLTADQAGTEQAQGASVALPKLVKVYPTLNLAFYQAGPAAGRLWYLMRAYDEAIHSGRGWLPVNTLYTLFGRGNGSGQPGGPWGIYGRRRLRQLLGEGEELGLWHRDRRGRLWLHAPHNVSEALGCGKLGGRPVYLPTAGLLGGIKLVRAHFYASWESGRRHDAPTSRATLEAVTGVPERTQRHYDQLLGRQSQTNIVVTDVAYTPESRQDATWHNGRNVLCFVDWKGKRGGEKRAEYIARRLPSTRDRCHEPAPKGRLRKHNRRITLVKNTAPGHAAEVVQVYHSSGQAAAAAFNRAPELVHFYPDGRALLPTTATPARLVATQLWGALWA